VQYAITDDMRGTDIFGIASGLIGTLVTVVALCTWLSPKRRLRALDAVMRDASDLIAILQEEGGVRNYAAVDRAKNVLAA
jgi:hypothetical protein